MGILFVPMFVAGLILMAKNPDLSRAFPATKSTNSESGTVFCRSSGKLHFDIGDPPKQRCYTRLFRRRSPGFQSYLLFYTKEGHPRGQPSQSLGSFRDAGAATVKDRSRHGVD